MAIRQLDISSGGTFNLTFSSPIESGVYTIHFINYSSDYSINWPANCFEANGTDMDTNFGGPFTEDNFYTCYYDGSNYYCK